MNTKDAITKETTLDVALEVGFAVYTTSVLPPSRQWKHRLFLSPVNVGSGEMTTKHCSFQHV